ncbi:MAG: UDP-2,3-diacylglucosamine diphosphatase [candidate division WOR-3 bacterium]|jgi:UDP-2,3-diacylglucosamine hydrolase
MHVFISDAHIRTDKSYRCQKLVRFLHGIRSRLTNLYILGDLFEFWFEYNLVFPKDYFTPLATLYNLIEDGKGVHYILGNHEVTIGRFLNNFGFRVHHGPTILNINGMRVLLEHGNKIDKRLWTSFWESLLTSKLNHALYRLLHPDLGIFLAQGIAYLSRKQHRSYRLETMLENYARRRLRDVDAVILGHSHQPTLKKFFGNKYYINTGDWVRHFSYAVIDRGSVSLHYYE